MTPEELQHLKDEKRRVYKEDDRKGGWRGKRGCKSVRQGSRG